MTTHAKGEMVWRADPCEKTATAKPAFPLDALTPYALRARRKISHLLGQHETVLRLTTQLDSAMCRRHCRTQYNAAAGFAEINFETTTHCNYRCPFCPQGIDPRPAEYMADDLLERIIDELAYIGFRGTVGLNLINEPLTHPHIMQFTHLVADRLPDANISIFTNGALLTEDMFKEFMSLPNPPYMKINDYTRQHNILPRVKTYLKHVPEHLKNTSRIRLAERSYDEKLSNRAGNAAGPDANAFHQRLMCTSPFQQLCIAVDGTVPLCYADYKYQCVMGDTRTQSLLDIWTGRKFADIRRRLLETGRRGIPLCHKCDAVCLDHFDQP